MVSLADNLARMRVAPPDATEFYAFTLTAGDDGEVVVASQTHWVGYQDDDCRVELRRARLVNMRMAELWNEIGQSCLFVTRSEQIPIFFILGGNALIDKTIAETLIPDWLEPYPCHHDGSRGFVDVHPSALKRAPTPKLRMKVLIRDGRRCRICGRRPDDDVDIVLNVHHIRPWENRGVTHEKNLITLCHTCHSGLMPHYDPSLFNYIENHNVSLANQNFEREVENFRRITRSVWERGTAIAT